VPAAVFDFAPRHHIKGIVGLKPRERPIIALEGEEALTEKNPRHIMSFHNSLNRTSTGVTVNRAPGTEGDQRGGARSAATANARSRCPVGRRSNRAACWQGAVDASTRSELLPGDRVMRRRSMDGVESKFIEAFQRWGKESMSKEMAIDAEVAGRVMRNIVELLCHEFGGQMIYIGKTIPWALSDRDRDIARSFNGTRDSATRLCKKHRISYRQFYVIIESERLRRKEDFAVPPSPETIGV
jgi:Mor family transcriptional regulator